MVFVHDTIKDMAVTKHHDKGQDMRTITDNRGRVWKYEDSEGTWEHAGRVIGCAAKNGRRFMFWDPDDRHPEEFDTVRDAMNSTL